MDSSSENLAELPSAKYPLVQTLLAFLALAAISYISNAGNAYDQTVLHILTISVWEGIWQLACLKLIAVPCAWLASRWQRVAFKHSYYKTLGVVYFVPYASFFLVVIAFPS